ncbi:MAG: hypothetical protein DMD94_21435 [Candidatus Rokuibacteriota bacterium]|nr:MAG: hypothetical protein DMD94_21435 [Candidatus Rokubacteria bacterium]
MAGFGGFRPAAFQFLRDLARNNQKAWFEANRDVYEREVRDPMRLLVETLDAKLGSIAPEIVGDPKRSMFRIHRDVPSPRTSLPTKPTPEPGSTTAMPGARWAAWARAGERDSTFTSIPPPASWPVASGCPRGPRSCASARLSPPSPPLWRGSRAHRDSAGDSTA